jgi:hypothetical protein
MKTIALMLAVCLSITFMVLSATSSVNHHSNVTVLDKGTILVDGGPLPSPIPPGHKRQNLIADGGPLPSPIPPGHKRQNHALTALLIA